MTQRLALVTGSSRGIGAAIALRLAHEGYRVALHGRAPGAALEQFAARLREAGADPVVLSFDVADRAACAAALDRFVAEHGAPYAVVCSAGITRDQAFPAMSGEDWDAVVHTNLDAFYNVLRPLVMPMVQRRAAGRIVVLSSLSGQIGNRGQTNYSASKAGLIGASKALAIELGKRGITVNCVAPGLIETDMLQDLAVDRLLEMIPLRRLGRVEEVAATVSFLLTEEAGYITRQVIAVNGGMSA